MKKYLTLALALCAFLFSCKKDETTLTPSATGYLDGYYVSNEGNFLTNNASVTFISSDGKVEEDPYFDANGLPIGDVLQQFLPIQGKGYAVLNNSQKIEVVDLKTFHHQATITGCDYPRFMLPLSTEKAYLTNGSLSGDVKVIDLHTHTITSSITVGFGPEKLAASDIYIAVCNSGGWNTDRTVTIINSTTDQVVATVTVGDRPNDVVTDADGNFWVICSGETLYDDTCNIVGHTAASIHRISVPDFTVSASYTIGVLGDHPRCIEIAPDGHHVYYENNGVYTFASDGADFQSTLLIPGSFSSISVAPTNGELWLTSTPDFVNNSQVYRYSPTGVLKNTYTAGIGANGVWFP